ncbi:SGNH/GDSL hydrolase family protein [Streptomyces sp. NPDC127068]|uniref:SGNH/GDSL hydrolase family protein n=1 Tax=Streptomyces sp. NPDC127068 TaxID=3347127 RepID=UPI00365A5110
MKPFRYARWAIAVLVGGALTLAVAPAATAADRPAYAALGDSYASGVGAGSYLSSSGACKRSTKAYPQLWAAAQAPSSFAFVACSGARTDEVLASQLAALGPGTGLVSLSVGGNDAGFADVMTTCVLHSEATCVARVNQARAYVTSTLPGKLDRTYAAVRDEAPSARVVVTGYPRFYRLNGTCVVGLSERERSAINAASDHLNTVISGRAAAAGFRFADVRGAFTGHEICSGDSWLHSVALPVLHSYHPTAAGQSGGYLPAFTAQAG